MSMAMEDEIKRWSAKRKAALAIEMVIIQGKTTASEISSSFANFQYPVVIDTNT